MLTTVTWCFQHSSYCWVIGVYKHIKLVDPNNTASNWYMSISLSGSIGVVIATRNKYSFCLPHQGVHAEMPSQISPTEWDQKWSRIPHISVSSKGPMMWYVVDICCKIWDRHLAVLAPGWCCCKAVGVLVLDLVCDPRNAYSLCTQFSLMEVDYDLASRETWHSKLHHLYVWRETLSNNWCISVISVLVSSASPMDEWVSS